MLDCAVDAIPPDSGREPVLANLFGSCTQSARLKGVTLVFLIILVVAAALLVGWLFVQLGRVTLGDFRVPRLREGSVQGASPSGSGVRSMPGSASGHATGASGHAIGASGHVTESPGRKLDADQSRPRPTQSRRTLARRQKRREQQVLYDETDVEQAVRDRLYGRHGRHD